MGFSSLDYARSRGGRIRSIQRILVYSLLATSCSLLAAHNLSSSTAAPFADGCTSCHQTQSGNVFILFGRSTHGQAGKSCSSCHGGDPNATDKQTAHGAGFMGQPTAAEQLRMCGM